MMRRWFDVLACMLALFVSVASIASPGAVAQPLGEEVQPPLPVHAMKRLWRDVDQLNFEIDQIHVYSRYCKPPKGPNKADTQWEIDFANSKYKQLQVQFDRMHAAFERAVTSRMTASFRSSFPTLDGLTADDQRYWARTSGMLTALANRIAGLQKQLDARKEEDCTKDNRQPPPPPPPPPVDWLKGLERPVAAPTSSVDLPAQFCSELEKGEWILKNVHPPRIQAAENARFASYYVVDVGKRMRELEDKKIFGPLTSDEERGLKLLKAEYKWAQDNLAEQDRKAAEMDAFLAAAEKIPVIECSQPSQTGVMGVEPITQPNYELFVYPAVPPRFCTKEEKDGVISQLTVALQIATRNYDTANAKVSEIADRIAKGDNSKSTSDAFRAASDAASSYFKTKEHLRSEISKAEAMPVVDCAREDKKAMNWGRTTPTDTGVPGAEPPVLAPQQPKTTETPSGTYLDRKEERPTVASAGATGVAGLGADAAVAFGTVHLPTFVYLGFENAALEQTFAVESLDDDEQFTAYSGGATLGVPALLRYGSPSVAGFVAFGFNTFDVDGSTFRSEIDPLGQDLLLPFTMTPGISLGSGVPEGTPGGFNVVTDFQYRYNADQFTLYAKYGQRWQCEDGALTGYAGLAYTNLDQRQWAAGDIPGFASDFRYSTDIEVDTWRIVGGVRYERNLFDTPIGGVRGFVDAMGSVNFVDGDGRDAVNVSGFLNFFESQDIAKSDTTFGYSLGAGLVQHIDEAAMDLYIAYRHMSDESTPVVVRHDDGPSHLTFERSDYDMIIVGARVQF